MELARGEIYSSTGRGGPGLNHTLVPLLLSLPLTSFPLFIPPLLPLCLFSSFLPTPSLLSPSPFLPSPPLPSSSPSLPLPSPDDQLH